ncbi:MAG: hypothetical protein DHS20C18_10730 [Saprospiraceae bacterium]|nr:MAG: hypothetical protein DHS20C18_10730 [Saprospiraceae bacterium]
MKTSINKLHLIIVVLFACQFSCQDLDVLDDCNFNTGIIIDPIMDCTTTALNPCVKTFRMENPELLPQGARITWTISKGGIPIAIPNPQALEFDMEFPEPGLDYAADLRIVFDFEGCDVSKTKPFRIGVDGPIAVIGVSTQQCIVGDCEITFTNLSENADSWFWTFLGDPDPSDHQGEQTVTKTFNIRPDTFQVVLTAFNLADTVHDTVQIFVEPVIFITDGSSSGADPGKVLSIDENADGSFTIIGTTESRTYTENILRDGTLLPESRMVVNTLPEFWSPRNAFGCYKVNNRHIVVGLGTNTNDGNQNAYLAAFDEDYLTTHEKVYAHNQDGTEKGFGITGTPDNGYLMCGAKESISPVQPTGMLFFKLNENFVKQSSIVRLDNSPFNQAFGIISISGGYAVIGHALNPASGEFEGCFFKMNNDFDVIGSVDYLGVNFIPNELVKINDDDYVILGRQGSTGVVIGKGTLTWNKTFGDSHLEKAILTRDNKLAIAGYAKIENKDTPILFTLNILTGIINGINKKYPMQNSGRIFSIAQTQENGFVLGGEFEGENEGVNLIIRTNKMGEVSN